MSGFKSWLRTYIHFTELSVLVLASDSEAGERERDVKNSVRLDENVCHVFLDTRKMSGSKSWLRTYIHFTELSVLVPVSDSEAG